jgi:hypothetical protein
MHSNGDLCSLQWLVVVAGGENDDVCLGDDVDEAVFVIDPPGPGAGQGGTSGVRLAEAGKGIPADVFNQLIHRFPI